MNDQITVNDQRLKILIVDDEPMICAGLSEKIAWHDLGFQVIGTARNGIEAINMIMENAPDVILSDIRMPRMDGLELIAWIRKNQYRIEVILLTGYNDFNYAREGIKFDIVAYILKPLDRDELVEAIDKAKSKICLHNKINNYHSQEPHKKRDHDNLHTDFTQVDTSLICRVKQYVDHNYMNYINLKSTAAHFEVNPSYLSRLFTQQVDMAFTDYINQVRMTKAIRLLSDTRQSVCSVARCSGYQNVRYFYKLFKERTGKTAIEYRNENLR